MTKTITILLVEDDEGHAELIARNLSRAGISNPIVHVSDGETALDLVFERGAYAGTPRPSPLLVLLDVRLPGIDGVAVLESLKASDATRHIPVVMLTSTDQPREIDRCYARGCNVYITKPVSYDEFSVAVRRLGMLIAVVQVPESGVAP